MEYRDVEIEAFGLKKTRRESGKQLWTYKVRLSDSPSGSMTADQAVKVQFDQIELAHQIDLLDRRALNKEGMVAFGQVLADYLIPDTKPAIGSSVRQLYRDNKSAATALGQGIRLRLKLANDIASLPWEFLYLDPPGGPGEIDGFLALDGRVSIVRHQQLDSAIPPNTAPAGDIKLVAAFASPSTAPPLNLDQERTNLESAISGTDNIDDHILTNATLNDLENSLLTSNTDIFHFGGHGEILKEMAETPGQFIWSGRLLFDDAEIEAEQLAINLRDKGVRLAMIGACNSGRIGGVNPWTGIASMLVKTGISAVVANQFKILDDTAIAFSEFFYKALVAGLTIEEAVAAGRKAAFNADPHGRDWGIQALYMRSENSQVLFAGTADQAKRTQYANAVHDVIIQNIVNINSGGGTVFTGNVTIDGDFVSGNQNTTISGPGIPSEISSPSDSILKPSGTLDPNVKAELTMLMGNLMQAVQPIHFQAVVDTKAQLENAFIGLKDGEKADVGHILTNLTDIAPAASDPIRAAFSKPVLANLISNATQTTIELLLP